MAGADPFQIEEVADFLQDLYNNEAAVVDPLNEGLVQNILSAVVRPIESPLRRNIETATKSVNNIMEMFLRTVKKDHNCDSTDLTVRGPVVPSNAIAGMLSIQYHVRAEANGCDAIISAKQAFQKAGFAKSDLYISGDDVHLETILRIDIKL